MVESDLEVSAGGASAAGPSTIVRDISQVGDISATVVIAIAEFFGTDPERLEPRLHDRLDPDALENLFEREGAPANVTVSLSLDGARLEIRDGTVRVTESTEIAQ
jgi:hypothetical protein